ncbi:MAG: hypothetical protein GX445_06085 [Elusimicrobia bacterium]|nr:hypothetical protein [Elusimicrobiota bacterium]
MKKLFLIFYLFSGVSYAENKDAGTSGFTFLKLPTGSARLEGLGNNGVALLEGTDAMSINPAGVGFAQMKELNFSIISGFEGYDGKYISYVEPHGTNVIGLNFGYYSADGFDVRDYNGVPLNDEEVTFKDMFGSFVFSKSFFMERFSLGAGVKYVSEDRYETNDNSVVFDAGAVLKLSRKISFGFSKQNISGDDKKVVQSTRYGMALSPNNYFTLLVDSKKYTDTDSKLSFGLEFTLPEEVLQYGRFVLRAGYNDSADYGKSYDDSLLENLGLTTTSGWSFGIGVYSAERLGRVYSLEYSITPYGELGKTSQFTFKLQF